MTPGRSLSAKTIGRSMAPVARTTSRARRCQSRSRARGEAPGRRRRRSCATIMFWSNQPDRHRSAAGTGHSGAASQPRARERAAGSSGRAALQRRRRPRRGSTRAPVAGGSRDPAGRPAPTTTTSAVSVDVLARACRRSRAPAGPPALRTASPSTSSTSVARRSGEPGLDRDQRVRLLGAGRQDPARPVRGRCCARPRRPRSRAAPDREPQSPRERPLGDPTAVRQRHRSRRLSVRSRVGARTPRAWVAVSRSTSNQRRQPWVWSQRSGTEPFGLERKKR